MWSKVWKMFSKVLKMFSTLACDYSSHGTKHCKKILNILLSILPFKIHVTIYEYRCTVFFFSVTTNVAPPPSQITYLHAKYVYRINFSLGGRVVEKFWAA